MLEERDALDRSKKKVQVVESEFTGDQQHVPRVESWMQDDEERDDVGSKANGGNGARWKSFKAAVMNKNGNGNSEEEAEDWWSGESWKDRVTVQMTDLSPNVIFPPSEKECPAKRWRNAFIVNLLGCMVDPIYLASKV